MNRQQHNLQKLPDPETHQTVSFIKSGFRIVGYSLVFFNLPAAIVSLILAEVIGVYEELV